MKKAVIHTVTQITTKMQNIGTVHFNPALFSKESHESCLYKAISLAFRVRNICSTYSIRTHQLFFCFL